MVDGGAGVTISGQAAARPFQPPSGQPVMSAASNQRVKVSGAELVGDCQACQSDGRE